MTLATAFCLIHFAFSMYLRAYSLFVRLCSTTLTWNSFTLRKGERVKSLSYLAKSALSHRAMQIKVIEIDFGVKINGSRGTAAYGAHISWTEGSLASIEDGAELKSEESTRAMVDMKEPCTRKGSFTGCPPGRCAPGQDHVT
jgi:hypothetical protein